MAYFVIEKEGSFESTPILLEQVAASLLGREVAWKKKRRKKGDPAETRRLGAEGVAVEGREWTSFEPGRDGGTVSHFEWEMRVETESGPVRVKTSHAGWEQTSRQITVVFFDETEPQFDAAKEALATRYPVTGMKPPLPDEPPPSPAVGASRRFYVLHRTREQHAEFEMLRCMGFSGASDASFRACEPLRGKIPERLSVYHADWNAIGDWPKTELGYEVWSRRMVDAVRAAAPLDAEIFEVLLQDGEEPDAIDRERYVAVNLLCESRDAVDWEASDVDVRERRGNKRVKKIRKLVLDPEKAPRTGAFRLYETGRYVILHEAVAEALMELPLRGVTILPLEELER